MERTLIYRSPESKEDEFILTIKQIGCNFNLKECNIGEEGLEHYLITEAYRDHSDQTKGVFCIFYEDEIIGYFSISFKNVNLRVRADESKTTTFIYLEHFAIKKEYQRKGIGSRILDFIIKEFEPFYSKYNCIYGIILYPLNSQVESFYQKKEFTLFEEGKYVPIDPDGNDIFMFKFTKEGE